MRTRTAPATGSPLTVDKRGLEVRDGQDVHLSIRSECVALDRVNGTNTPADGHSILGTYDESVYLGLTTTHMARLADGTEMLSRVIDEARRQGLDLYPGLRAVFAGLCRGVHQAIRER